MYAYFANLINITLVFIHLITPLEGQIDKFINRGN